MAREWTLHTFARRYCIERSAYWQEKYVPINEAALSQLGSQGYEYSDKAYDIFPRYNVLDAILLEVETLDPDELPPLPVLTKSLIRFGRTASPDFTGNAANEIAENAESEERSLFIEAIEHVADNDAFITEPLPYRRVLRDEETENLWLNIQKR